MKKKHLVIVGVIILSAIVILGLYQTFALSSDITKDTSGYYNVTITDGTTITVPAGSTKTVYYKLTNTNKGIVKYGVGYSGTNITVKYYTDTIDPVTGTVDYGKSKYIKLSVENTGTTSSTATLSTILGYENGGDLIVPSGVTLVTEVYTEPVIAATLITNLYNDATKTSVTNGSKTYQYDTTNSLMKDAAGHIRYYGASPNNYIYFNCSNYSSQTSTTCEKWRIIGYVDNKVKLIRGSQIGTFSWDNKNDSTGGTLTYGKNDWTNARIMRLLNPSTYYTTDSNDNGYGQSLYWNAKSGTCFFGANNATKPCDFTSIGIKNTTTKNLISETKYYLGGSNTFSIYSNQMYDYERGKAVFTGRPTEWTGKVGLAYPSDYGYAADFRSCTQDLDNYNNSACTSKNWMKAIIAPNYGALINPHSDVSYSIWRINQNGGVGYNTASTVYGITPVIYLDPKLAIKSGTGSSSAPYQLSI